MGIIRKRHCSDCGQIPTPLDGKRFCGCPGKLYYWCGGERGTTEEEERLRQARYFWIAEPGYYAFENVAPIICTKVARGDATVQRMLTSMCLKSSSNVAKRD
jgi:hypothetical protein